MNITRDIAQSIVHETFKIIQRNINFMNREGEIIASLDIERIGQIHEGALEVLQSKRKVIVQHDSRLKGAKPGVNLPVHLNNQIIGVIGITGAPAEIEQLGEVIQKLTEILIKEIYLDEQLELKSRAKETFINEWISRSYEDEKWFASRGWMLGMNVHLHRCAIVIDLVNFTQQFYDHHENGHYHVKKELEAQRVRRDVLHIIEQTVCQSTEDIAIPLGSSKYVILKTISSERSNEYKKTIRSSIKEVVKAIGSFNDFVVRAGVGSTFKTIHEASTSYYEADVTSSYASLEKPILFHDELGIESFVDEISEVTKQKFIKRILKTTDEELLHSLRVFFQCDQSVNEAAKKLFIHKNTLQYRLKKIKDVTGHDPRQFKEAVQLHMALLLLGNSPIEQKIP